MSGGRHSNYAFDRPVPAVRSRPVNASVGRRQRETDSPPVSGSRYLIRNVIRYSLAS